MYKLKINFNMFFNLYFIVLDFLFELYSHFSFISEQTVFSCVKLLIYICIICSELYAYLKQTLQKWPFLFKYPALDD